MEPADSCSTWRSRGHVSRKMPGHYSHIGMGANRMALALEILRGTPKLSHNDTITPVRSQDKVMNQAPMTVIC